ncbi:MAG: zf-HC2 domain-containing protein [Paucibacter sp.]|nr:zf-HC2 domain-containing protein [Roseateles sp.]
MSTVIPMEHDEHVATQALLPWYTRGQLDDAEMRQVQAHLEHCPACQAELAAERPLRTLLDLATPPAGSAEAGIARMRRRLSAEAKAQPRRAAPWMPWALGLQGATIAALLGVLLVPAAPALYHGLSAEPAAAGIEALVMFKPGSSEAEVRAALLAHGASISSGPTESGAYRLHLTADPAALAALRAENVVALAEPLEPRK